jgi:hypothetical protein
MTIYYDPDGVTMDVYDHEGTRIGSGVVFGGSWSGDFPDEVLDVAREAMDGAQPSRYNQKLLADMASENIEQGQP